MVAKVEVPVTERVPPMLVSPVVVSEVKEGVAERPMVEVEVKVIFAPAVRLETGELKKEFHCVDDAVRGILYPADGARESVCTPVPVFDTTKISSPDPDEVANVCEATVLPLSDVMVPPAPPASVPQMNVPLDQRSFSVDALHEVRLAPKSDAKVRPPVEEALVK